MKLLKLLTLLAVATGGIAPIAMAADEPIVREIYACSFNEGKDMGDLMAARDFYLKQMEKAGLDAAVAFVWTPYKAAAGFDFLWANNQASVLEFATSSDAYLESPEGQAAAARFDSVASCSSYLAMRRQLYQAEGEMTLGSNGAVINTLACNYRSGRGPDDLIDLNSHITEVMDSLDLDGGGAGYVSVPSVGSGPNTRDVYFYGVASSTEAWARRNMALQASPGAASLGRHFGAMLECSSALFFGQRVVPPLE